MRDAVAGEWATHARYCRGCDRSEELVAEDVAITERGGSDLDGRRGEVTKVGTLVGGKSDHGSLL